jgi:hypothetical protein
MQQPIDQAFFRPGVAPQQAAPGGFMVSSNPHASPMPP